jgi:RimJ/RimL family protein N-acetyltransferase
MIEGRFVNLRALEESDLAALKKWRNDKKTRIHTREYRLLNMINQRNWFESLHTEQPPKNIMFGVTNKSNRIIGVCGLTYIDWKNRHAEVSIILSLPNWQKTREAENTIELLFEYGFGELNLHRLWAEIFDTIPATIKLFEKMNFVKEGTLRDRLWRNNKWHNSFIYAVLSNEKTIKKKN